MIGRTDLEGRHADLRRHLEAVNASKARLALAYCDLLEKHERLKAEVAEQNEPPLYRQIRRERELSNQTFDEQGDLA